MEQGLSNSLVSPKHAGSSTIIDDGQAHRTLNIATLEDMPSLQKRQRQSAKDPGGTAVAVNQIYQENRRQG